MQPTHEQIMSQQNFMREISGKAAEHLIARAKKVKESIDNGKPEYDMLLTGDYNSWITEFDR